VQIVLVHSPLVGPSTWRPVAARLRADGFDVVVPSLRGDDMVGAITAAATARRCALVAHSGAGLLVPGAVTGAVAAIVLVDTPVPPRSGTVRMATGGYRRMLADLAGADGVLPPWSRWWGDGVFAALVPDEAIRAELEDEMPALPLSFFDRDIAVPAGWDSRPVTYVQLSGAYDDDAAACAARGWPVARLPGQHLDIVTRPAEIAGLIARAVAPDDD
jgi:hypothetical protein